MNDPLTERIIAAAFQVHNQLGFGFLESIYERALTLELDAKSIRFESQKRIKVLYANQVIGEFVCDLFVENRLIVELKAVSAITVAQEIQLVNYLAATQTDVGLLINFGAEKVEVKRKYRRLP